MRRPDITTDQIATDYQAGASLRDLEARYGMSHAGIAKRLKKAGIVRHPASGMVNVGDLHKALRACRKARNLTLREVSEASGLSISYLSDIERGRTVPRLDTLVGLLAVYGLTCSILLEAAR